MDLFIPAPPAVGVDRFGREFKNWREWNNAKDFLKNLAIEFNPTNLFCVRPDPPDVVYGEIRLEIKEIMDEGRRRHDEVKEEIAKHGQTLPYASNPQGLIFDLQPLDVAKLIVKNLDSYDSKEKYKDSFKEKTDILFYINIKYHHFDEGEMPSSAIFEKYGWRSICCVVRSDVSIIFHASANAPTLLRDRTSKYFETP